MKGLIIPAICLLLSISSKAQLLAPIDSSSAVTFKIKNLGFNTSGSFSGVAGTITFSPDNLAGCNFDVHVDANTVNTDMEMRDNHLRGEDYFDVKKYPQIRFVSTKITNSNKKGTLFVFGNLTIKGITKEISFPFTAIPTQDGYLFNGEFKMNRREFNVGGGSTLSDQLTVILKVVARKI
jgi:polyisoprenoid-binding protein YceI